MGVSKTEIDPFRMLIIRLIRSILETVLRYMNVDGDSTIRTLQLIPSRLVATLCSTLVVLQVRIKGGDCGKIRDENNTGQALKKVIH